MKVIRHEAVRHNRELILGRGSHNLRQSEIDDVVSREEMSAIGGAKRQGISIDSEVVERF
jgi:hypothetical protein